MQNVDLQHFKQFVKYHTFLSFNPLLSGYLIRLDEVGFAKQTLIGRVGYTDSVG